MRALFLASWFLSACAQAGTVLAPPPAPGQAVAVFAGGCFWCVEKDFEKLDGVFDAQSGYTGGVEASPTYRQVASYGTTHLEAVRVVYDPSKLSYPQLVRHFFRHIDPTQADGQFCDRGAHYQTAVFVADAGQRAVAEAEKAEVERLLNVKVVTEIAPVGPFWLAEDEHQDFYKKNAAHYARYRAGCGRDPQIRALWGRVESAGQGSEPTATAPAR